MWTFATIKVSSISEQRSGQLKIESHVQPYTKELVLTNQIARDISLVNT